MIRIRSHRRGSIAGHGTPRLGGVRRSLRTCPPRAVDVPPPARFPWPSAMPRGLPSTLVLLALLLLAVSAVHAAYDPEIEAVQRELTERGYNPGTIDGAMGWRTRGALREFQRSAGIPDTGYIDDATRAALGLAPGPGTKRAPEGSADSTGADDTARTEPATEPETVAPKDKAARTELVIVPENGCTEGRSGSGRARRRARRRGTEGRSGPDPGSSSCRKRTHRRPKRPGQSPPPCPKRWHRRPKRPGSSSSSCRKRTHRRPKQPGQNPPPCPKRTHRRPKRSAPNPPPCRIRSRRQPSRLGPNLPLRRKRPHRRPKRPGQNRPRCALRD